MMAYISCYVCSIDKSTIPYHMDRFDSMHAHILRSPITQTHKSISGRIASMSM